jgi:fructose-1,6-bisphosphatase I
MIGTTVTQFLIEEQRKFPSATGDLTLVIRDIVTACKAIALAMRYGPLTEGDVLGVTSTQNVHGEEQKKLDVLANRLFLQRTGWAGHVAGMVSEEMEEPHQLPERDLRGRYLLLYDPVDGSSNINDNTAIGTIFSILRRSDEAVGPPGIEEFLQPGTRQVCAGYALYGPSCLFVMTTGNGVNGFTLDPGLGEFLLTHPLMTIPGNGLRLYANMSHVARWDEPIRRFLEDAARRPEVDLRWSAGAVADVHRLLMSGGVYVGPVEDPEPTGVVSPKLRLLYEVNPLAMIVEQAGGVATDGRRRILDIEPADIHQQVLAILGSRTEMNRVLTEYFDRPGRQRPG